LNHQLDDWNVSQEDWEADDKSHLQLDSGIQDPDSPEHQELSAATTDIG
jgi:hypothetical protein